MFPFQINPTIDLKENMLKMMELKLHIRQLSLSESVCSSDDSESSSPSTSSSISPSTSSFLTRQSSTSSLPSKKSRQSEDGVSRSRHRLSYSFQRIRKRPKNLGEGESVHNNNVSLLPEQYSELKKVHADFEQFLNVVVEDLTEKTEKLVKYKNSDSVTAHEENFANLQVFMLTKYSSRIENFKTVASQRVEHICLAHNKNCSTDSVTNLVNKVRSSTYISGNCK